MYIVHIANPPANLWVYSAAFAAFAASARRFLSIDSPQYCSAILTVTAHDNLGSVTLAYVANRKHRGVDGLQMNQIWVNLPAHRIMGCASTDGAQVEVPADTYSTRSDLQQSMP